MDNITILVTYYAKPGMRDEFIGEITDKGILDAIRAEKGCLFYEYYRATDDKNRILLVEKWDCEETQRVHMTQPHMEELKAIKERCIDSTDLEILKG